MKSAWRICLLSAWVAAAVMAAGCGVREPAGSGGQSGAVEQAAAAAAAKGALGWVDRLRVGEPAGYGSLLVFPVISEAPAIGEEYLTLDEGIRLKLVRVTEVAQRETPEQTRMTVAEIEAQIAAQGAPPDDGGSVNTLLVHNHSDKPLFILSGQTVCGGKQDRICYEDVIVPPHTSNFEIKVFCVEQGRWHLMSDDGAFEANEVAVDSVRKIARAEKDQGKVWSGVHAMRIVSQRAVGFVPIADRGTDAYLDSATDPKLKEKRAPYLDALAGKWKDEKKLAGFVVVIDGHIRSADVFNDPGVFAKLRESLLRSYASRAALAEGEKTADTTKVEATAKPVTRAEVEAFLKSAYAEREKMAASGSSLFSTDDGGAAFGAAGGELNRGDRGLQHIYLSVEEKEKKEKEQKEQQEQDK